MVSNANATKYKHSMMASEAEGRKESNPNGDVLDYDYLRTSGKSISTQKAVKPSLDSRPSYGAIIDPVHAKKEGLIAISEETSNLSPIEEGSQNSRAVSKKSNNKKASIFD